LTSPQAACAKEFDVAIAFNFNVSFNSIPGDPNPEEKSKSMREETIVRRFFKGGRSRAMEDEARWMISNNLTPEKSLLDLMNYIYVDGLGAVKPEAVNIIW
jgi:hypothetical protein